MRRILADLPSDFPATVLVVMHLGATSYLAEILQQAIVLPVRRAESGKTIAAGDVYVAVPGLHLLVHEDHLLLRRGPRENLVRPAVDPLFRSAAATYGARVIGVILSGALNDGSAGTRAIKQCGGLAIVQSTADAAYPDMPRMRCATPTSTMRCLPPGWAPCSPGWCVNLPGRRRQFRSISVWKRQSPHRRRQAWPWMINWQLWPLRPARSVTAPCGRWDDGSLLRYRCHVGHAFTAETMLAAQATQAEELMWSLMPAHQERAALCSSPC